MPPRPYHTDVDRFCEYDPGHDLTGLSPSSHRCPVCSAPLVAGHAPELDDRPEHRQTATVDAPTVDPTATEAGEGPAALIPAEPTPQVVTPPAKKRAPAKKAAASKKAAKKATSARKAAATPSHPTRAPELLSNPEGKQE